MIKSEKREKMKKIVKNFTMKSKYFLPVPFFPYVSCLISNHYRESQHGTRRRCHSTKREQASKYSLLVNKFVVSYG